MTVGGRGGGRGGSRAVVNRGVPHGGRLIAQEGHPVVGGLQQFFKLRVHLLDGYIRDHLPIRVLHHTCGVSCISCIQLI